MCPCSLALRHFFAISFYILILSLNESATQQKQFFCAINSDKGPVIIYRLGGWGGGGGEEGSEDLGGSPDFQKKGITQNYESFRFGDRKYFCK